MFEWTDEKIQCVKDLWGKQSASEIAGIIGHHSRNAVCGKAHRLGLSNGYKPAKTTVCSTPFLKPRVQRFREVLNTGAADVQPLIRSGEGDPSVMPDYSRPGSHSCTMMDLTSDTCRWPLWSDAQPEHLYCGAPGADMESKRPYCPQHSRMAYRARAAA